MAGPQDGWARPARNLKAEIDEERIKIPAVRSRGKKHRLPWSPNVFGKPAAKGFRKRTGNLIRKQPEILEPLDRNNPAP